jgi:hypothetical protein
MDEPEQKIIDVFICKRCLGRTFRSEV